MVERVARVLDPEGRDNPAESFYGDDGIKYLAGVPTWKRWEDLARAAIAAMREPTPAMIDAMAAYIRSPGTPNDPGAPWSPVKIYQAAIDEALK